MCGRTSVTHHDHIVFIIFEFNDETIITHTHTLYFSYMKPLNFILLCSMTNAQVLSFLENGRGSLYLSHAWYCPDKIQPTNILQKILCSLFFNNYFVVMILNIGMMIWIKTIFDKSFFCQTKGLLHGKKFLVQYTYNEEKKTQKIDINIS